MNRHLKQAGTALLLAALLCLPSGCKKKDDSGEGVNSNLPQEYTLGEASIPALTPGEEEGPVTLGEAAVYTYSGLADPGQTASSYASQLTGSESGFSVVDEELVRTDRPDFSEAEGQIRLAKAIEGEEKKDDGEDEDGEPAEPSAMVQSVWVAWTEGTCTVTVEEAAGVITDPPVEPEPITMTLTEALDYVKSLPPAALGLDGASMEDYQIYSEEGIVWVDDQTCIRINVYSIDTDGGFNEVAGCYLLASDQSHLYQLDDVTHAVRELPLDDVFME